MNYQCYLSTPLGCLEIVTDANFLLETSFIGEQEGVDSKDKPDILIESRKQLKDYFDNKRKSFDLPMKPAGTPFQRKVWNALIQVSHGQSMSYLTLSKKLGDVKAIRAVAKANGANPIPIIIPCHRIIGSNGKLTGYSGGLWRKEWLLDFESGQGRLF